MARGGRFAYDPTPMPVLAFSPSRGDRFAPLMGAQHMAPETYRPAALAAAWRALEALGDADPGYGWIYLVQGDAPALTTATDYAAAMDQIGEALRAGGVAYWAVIEVGASGPQIARDQVLASNDTGVSVSGDFHTIPDREAAWAILQKAGEDLQSDVAAAKLDQTANPALIQLRDYNVKPFLTEWHAFVDDNEAGRKNVDTAHSWQIEYATAGAGGADSAWRKAFDAYDHWLSRFADLRAALRNAGVMLHTPEPPKPGSLPSTQTVLEKIEHLPGDVVNAAKKIEGLGKAILIGGGVLGGVLVINAIANR